MPQYNDMFELSVEDMDLIEQALRQAMTSYATEITGNSNEDRTNLEDTVRRMHDLLGRLHDQKIFYRPKHGTYIGG